MAQYYRTPAHLRDQLLKDPMYLQKKHDEEVSQFRRATGADTWMDALLPQPTTPVSREDNNTD